MGRVAAARRRAATGAFSGLSVVPMPLPPDDIDVVSLVEKAFGRKLNDPNDPNVPNVPNDSNGSNVSNDQRVQIDPSLTEKIVIDDRIDSVSREQYRRVAAVLHEAQRSSGLRAVMVASAVPGEGKTLTAINLALTLSESYRRRVLLVDGDLRAPALHRSFGVTPAAGVAGALSSSQLAVSHLSPTLALLGGGDPTSDPMADLTSDRMRRVIMEAKQTYDWVIVDTPPVVLLPDAPLLASMVDGVVLVIRAGSTPHALVARAIDCLGRSRIVGAVLNGARPDLQGMDDRYSRPGAGLLT